jgi:hypothetical protein
MTAERKFCPRAVVNKDKDRAICYAPGQGRRQGCLADVLEAGCGERLKPECDEQAERQAAIKAGKEDPLKGKHPSYGTAKNTRYAQKGPLKPRTRKEN